MDITPKPRLDIDFWPLELATKPDGKQEKGLRAVPLIEKEGVAQPGSITTLSSHILPSQVAANKDHNWLLETHTLPYSNSGAV